MNTATVIQMSIQRMICTGCSAEANTACNCGKAYIPAAQRAAAAVAANPESSDRAIAADTGCCCDSLSGADDQRQAATQSRTDKEQRPLQRGQPQ